MITKQTFAWISMVLGMVAVVACGGGEGGEGTGGKGSGGATATNTGTGTNAGTNTNTGVFICCLNDAHYRCPDKASFDKCSGFDIDACIAACSPTDFDCTNTCFTNWSSATHDPSGCKADSIVQCGTGGTGGTGGGGPGLCVGDWDGTQCDYDVDCASNNCYENKCYANDIGNPCEYDVDCNSNNCYQNCCYGNAPGDPCEYDVDCTSNNCFNNECQ